MKYVTLFAVATFMILSMSGCAVQKTLTPTGGSRADGTVKLSFEYGMFEAPKLDKEQGQSDARKRCLAWGYTDAEAFGGGTKSCISHTNNGCARWLVTIEYQCTGTGTPATSNTPMEQDKNQGNGWENADESWRYWKPKGITLK